MDRDGIKPLLEGARERFPCLCHLWLDGGYNCKGKGKGWVEKALGLAAEIVRHPPKPRHVWSPEGEAVGPLVRLLGRFLTSFWQDTLHDGSPVPNAHIEVWQSDEDGFYSVRYEGLDETRGRGQMNADEEGS